MNNIRNRLTNKHEELDIEREFQVIAGTKYGCAARKFIDPSVRGAPDRLVLCPGGHAFFIEFKRPGEKPAAAQILYHTELASLGFSVYTCDNVADALIALKAELKKCVTTA
jgi:hypothetical protein